MKRLHVHVNVPELDAAITWYTALFDTPPTVTRPDYAKWMLEDPRVNFAVSTGSSGDAGLSHLGIQAETADELEGLSKQLATARTPVVEERNATCCYALSDKHWGQDPAGIGWELFHTTGQADTMGSSVIRSPEEESANTGSACC